MEDLGAEYRMSIYLHAVSSQLACPLVQPLLNFPDHILALFGHPLLVLLAHFSHPCLVLNHRISVESDQLARHLEHIHLECFHQLVELLVLLGYLIPHVEPVGYVSEQLLLRTGLAAVREDSHQPFIWVAGALVQSGFHFVVEHCVFFLGGIAELIANCNDPKGT